MIHYKEIDVFKTNYYRIRKGKFSDDVLTFDIECSSGFYDGEKVVSYTKGKKENYWNNLMPVSLCYIWQFSYNDTVYYGRYIEEFLEVLKKLDSDINYVIYIHNLSYEFHILSNILTWKEVFTRTPHKPIKCIANEFPNVEFRCSYNLNRISLRSWGESIGEYKAESIDYEKIRTPLTKLSEEEMFYCEQDCIVLYKGIKKYLEKYGHIKNIPLTQTGEIRKVVKKKLIESDKRYCRNIVRISPNTYNDLLFALHLFQGGYCHANMIHTGRIFTMEKDGVLHSFDFASSYPYVLCSEKYPMTKFVYKPYDKKYMKDYCYILKVKFTNIQATNTNHYIMAHKCIDGENLIKDNGRIISGTFTTYITSIDMEIIEKVYKWDSIEIIESKASRLDYLPKVLIEYILELYNDKTSLKGVTGQEDFYLQKKQFINSLFGMMVTSVINDEIVYDDGQWIKTPKTEQEINDFFDKLKHRNYGKIFLSFYWSIFCTAYARKNLWDCILSCGDNGNGNDVIYCDTDSIKCRNKHDFSWYNNEVDEKLKKMCKHYNIVFSLTRPKTIKGVEKPLGYFEEEETMSEFITLGAKKYCYRTQRDGKLHITISGINKGAVDCLNDDIHNFADGFIFDKDHDSVSKKLCHYCENQPFVIWNKGSYDEFESHYTSGINLRRTGYKIGITDEYEKLVELFNAIEHYSYYDDRLNVSRENIREKKADKCI